MRDYETRKLATKEFPLLLKEIPQPPKSLYLRGNLPDPDAKCLAVVGSRNYTNYGKQVVEYLIRGLRGYDIAIVSGLALGIDALAHESALENNLYTLAVPGSGIDDSVLYPSRNRGLASRILDAGGGLLSEFEPTFTATTWSFPARNRIMAGLSHATLVIEASERSGTLITARLTTDYNRELLVVPGNIFSENSKGAHQFLKLGATPVTTPEDILLALNIDIKEDKNRTETLPENLSEVEIRVLSLITEPIDRDSLTRALGLPVNETSVLLMQLELNGYIKEENGIFYKY